MALGDLTKQLAQQALLSATKDPPAQAPADQSGAVVLAQIAAMQRALKEDEELVVHCDCVGERIRVTEIFMASPLVAVVTGTDTNRAVVRVVSAVAALQLLCRTVKLAEGAKAVRVGLFMPKPKDSNG
jgi:hypothetical protein